MIANVTAISWIAKRITDYRTRNKVTRSQKRPPLTGFPERRFRLPGHDARIV